jgi:hypothetical protein
MFYAQKQIKLHQRCLDVLDLIVSADKAIEEARHYLHRYDNCKDHYAPLRLFNNREDLDNRLRRYRLIKDRIVMWYADIERRLIEEVVERADKENVVSISEKYHDLLDAAF